MNWQRGAIGSWRCGAGQRVLHAGAHTLPQTGAVGAAEVNFRSDVECGSHHDKRRIVEEPLRATFIVLEQGATVLLRQPVVNGVSISRLPGLLGRPPAGSTSALHSPRSGPWLRRLNTSSRGCLQYVGRTWVKRTVVVAPTLNDGSAEDDCPMGERPAFESCATRWMQRGVLGVGERTGMRIAGGLFQAVRAPSSTQASTTEARGPIRQGGWPASERTRTTPTHMRR
jgi:hypothetical protein